MIKILWLISVYFFLVMTISWERKPPVGFPMPVGILFLRLYAT
jgi:hypothetical protein